MQRRAGNLTTFEIVMALAPFAVGVALYTAPVQSDSEPGIAPMTFDSVGAMIRDIDREKSIEAMVEPDDANLASYGECNSKYQDAAELAFGRGHQDFTLASTASHSIKSQRHIQVVDAPARPELAVAPALRVRAEPTPAASVPAEAAPSAKSFVVVADLASIKHELEANQAAVIASLEVMKLHSLADVRHLELDLHALEATHQNIAEMRVRSAALEARLRELGEIELAATVAAAMRTAEEALAAQP